MNPKKISLSNLKIGSKAIIDSLDEELQYKTRFTEMGIIPGKEILLMQRYSKKGPVCIKVMGSFVMIRKENADKIIVSKDTGE
ncbi:MAG: hypothetical protein CMG13_00025 [Candidatus Marinimicrobia bacterium]|nr:hypothetical protein [Candidatus Neomarinimicrobiota bacterium]